MLISPSPHNQTLIHLARRTLPQSPPPMTTPNPTTTTRRTRKPQLSTPSKCSNSIPDIEDFSPQETQELRSSLLQWYDEHHRKLPWRTERNTSINKSPEDRAYAVWVSEIMLQQTRVQTVIAYYNRWMEKWPTVHHLAAASLEEVNEMWAGLGYYRRGRFLLEGAKAIVEGGEFPRTVKALCKVKGIGDYTAGAIASIAFDEAVPVVDGNVVRVITRLRAISACPKETATVKNIWKLAGQMVDPSRPGDFNQAIMELGATLCTVASPNCFSCPVSQQCRALSLSGRSKAVKVTDYPTKVAKTKQRSDFAAVCVVEITEGKNNSLKNGYLLVKRPDEGLLAGLWEFPSVLVDEEETDMGTRRTTMDKYLKKLFDIDIGTNCEVILREDVGEYLHVFSHIRLRMHVELLTLSLREGLNLIENGEQSVITWKFVGGDSIESMGLTSSVRKAYNMSRDFKQKQLSRQPKIVARKRTKRST